MMDLKLKLKVDEESYQKYNDKIMELENNSDNENELLVAAKSQFKKMIESGLDESADADIKFLHECQLKVCPLCGRTFKARNKNQVFCNLSSNFLGSVSCSDKGSQLKLHHGIEAVRRFSMLFKVAEPLYIALNKGEITKDKFKEKMKLYQTAYRHVSKGKITDEQYTEALKCESYVEYGVKFL